MTNNLRSQSAAPQDMRNFTLVWIGQVVSLIGSGMTCFAQSVYVYTDMGGSITHLMLLAAMAQLPGVLISPLAGMLADRFNRRWVMLISDTVAALATLTLRTLVVTNNIQIWQMYVIVVIISIANHCQWPAYFSAVPLLVPPKHLGRANGMVQVGRSLGQIAAPVMAGVAVTFFRLQGVILFDMGSYLFAAAMLLIIRFPDTPKVTAPSTRKVSLWQEAMYGWTYLLARPGMVGLLALFAAANFLFASTSILITPLALSITTAAVLGSAMSVGGISMLAGSALLSAWGGPKRRIYGVLGAMALQGVAFLLIGIKPSVPLLFAGYIVFSFASPFVNACSGIIWQSKVPADVQGRVMAASTMVSTTFLECGYLSSGPLADYVFIPLMMVGGPLAASLGSMIGTGELGGLGLMFIVMGIACVAMVGVGFLYPRLRNLDEELPDVLVAQALAQVEGEQPAAGQALRQIDLMQG